jgi:predicted SAM-dependent methyltransferase
MYMQNQELKRLNLGCGHDIRPGWVNLDSAKIEGVDVVHDIERLPLPFKDGEFDEILCNDVLEHVEYIPVLRDLHRILKPGGKLTIRVPHFTSRNTYSDPTHKKAFGIRTMEFFVQDSQLNKDKHREYYFDFHFSKLASVKITFEKNIFFIKYVNNYIIAPLVNSSQGMCHFFEQTGFSRMFPAENIIFELMK